MRNRIDTILGENQRQNERPKNEQKLGKKLAIIFLAIDYQSQKTL